jgi:hypothetical protein
MRSSSRPEKFTLVIPVMGKPMLGQVLQYYCRCAREFIERVVVVDYDAAFSEAYHLYEPLADTPHVIIAINGEAYFNKSRAINVGVGFAGAACMAICDADVLIVSETLAAWQQMLLEERRGCVALYPVEMIETANGVSRDAPGIVALRMAEYLCVRGYSNEFVGWGFEDRDFLWRLDAAGVKTIKAGSARHISHSEVERTQNYACVDNLRTDSAGLDRLRMRERNLQLFEARKRRNVTAGTLYEDLALFGLKAPAGAGAASIAAETAECPSTRHALQRKGRTDERHARSRDGNDAS